MQSATFWQGIEQFNQQDFYGCHDTLESLWMEAAEPEKTFYQGILQIAVGCYHLGNHNWRGSVILLGEGIRKLSEYQPIYEEVNITNLIEVSTNLLQKLQQINPEEIAEVAQEVIFPKILRHKTRNTVSLEP